MESPSILYNPILGPKRKNVRQGHFFPMGLFPSCTSESCSQCPFFTIVHKCKYFSLEPVIGGLTLVSMGPAWVGAPLVLLEDLQEAAVWGCKPAEASQWALGTCPAGDRIHLPIQDAATCLSLLVQLWLIPLC